MPQIIFEPLQRIEDKQLVVETLHGFVEVQNSRHIEWQQLHLASQEILHFSQQMRSDRRRTPYHLPTGTRHDFLIQEIEVGNPIRR